MNYLIDLGIIAIFIFYLIDGYRQGFIKNTLDLLGFMIALSIAFLANSFISNLLATKTDLPLSLSKIIAFLSIWLLVDIAYSIAIFFIYRPIPKDIKEAQKNKIFGIIPAFFKATIIILLVLVFLTSIPIKESLTFKKETEKTKLARIFLDSSSPFSRPYQAVFGKGIEDLVNFFTLPTASKDTLALNYRVSDLKIDEDAENEMLLLINQERKNKGITELKMDDKLRSLARDHAKDMFSRGYFSHYTAEGLGPFERMKKAEIIYLYAGENLALAPDVSKAHQGLMESEGHRRNILNPNFNHIGLGVIDGDIYGKMFAQEFTN